jgi:hypothetical protein
LETADLFKGPRIERFAGQFTLSIIWDVGDIHQHRARTGLEWEILVRLSKSQSGNIENII